MICPVFNLEPQRRMTMPKIVPSRNIMAANKRHAIQSRLVTRCCNFLRSSFIFSRAVSKSSLA